MNMMTRNIIECMAFALLAFVLILAVNSPVQANDDFSLRLTMNGVDIDNELRLAFKLFLFHTVISDFSICNMKFAILSPSPLSPAGEERLGG